MESTRSYSSVVGSSPFATGRVIDWADVDSDEDFGELPVAATRSTEEEIEEEEVFEEEEQEEQSPEEVARELLNISSEDWDTFMQVKKSDTDGRLILVGWNQEVVETKPLPLELHELRGVVVDTRARVIVCAGSEYTEKITVNKLITSPDSAKDGAVSIRVKSAVLGREIEFNIETDSTTRASYYSQGVNLKVFLHNGKLRVITNKHIDPSGKIRGGAKPSAFNNTEPFTDSFFRLVDEKKLRKLFPKKCNYSPYSYNFFLSVPHLTTSTRILMPQNGYLTFIRKDKCWSLGDDACPFKENKEDADGFTTFWVGEEPDYHGLPKEKLIPFFTDDGTLEDGTGKALPISYEESFNYHTKILTVRQVEKLLFAGLEETRKGRSFLGEAVILTKVITLANNKKVFYSIRLQSPAYEWREKIFQVQKDTYKLYLDLITQSAPVTMEMLDKRFPVYGESEAGYGWSVDNLDYTHDIPFFATNAGIRMPRLDVSKSKFPEGKDWVDVVSLFFKFLLSPSRQFEALNCYNRYRSERNYVCAFVIDNYFNPKDKVSTESVRDKYQGKDKKYSHLLQFASQCFTSAEYRHNSSADARNSNRKLVANLLNRNNETNKSSIIGQAIFLSGNSKESGGELLNKMQSMTSLYKLGLEGKELEPKMRKPKKNQKPPTPLNVEKPVRERAYKRADEKNKVKRPGKPKNFQGVKAKGTGR